MKSLLKIWGFFLMLLFVSANADAQNMKDMKDKISGINDKLEEAMLSDNLDAVMMYYADDAISLPSYGEMRRGKDEIREMSEEAPEKIKSVEFETVDVFGEGKYLYEIGTYDIALEIPQMGEIKDKGKYLTVWEMQPDGSLKMKAEIWNTNTSPQEMMNMMEAEGSEDY